jgi:hypothetical protein
VTILITKILVDSEESFIHDLSDINVLVQALTFNLHSTNNSSSLPCKLSDHRRPAVGLRNAPLNSFILIGNNPIVSTTPHFRFSNLIT